MSFSNKYKSLSLDIVATTLYRLLLVMFLFSLMRIGFYLMNENYFPDMNLSKFLFMMYGGLRFDIVAILYTNTLFLLLFILPITYRYNLTYQKTAKWIYVISNGIIIAANCVDFVYFRFTAKRTTATVFKEFQNEFNFGSLLKHFVIDYWYMYVAVAFMIFILIKLYGKHLTKPAHQANPFIYYPLGVIILGLIAGLFVAGVRGGFAHSTRPITLSNAGEYVEKPLEISIVLNTPFSIYKTLGIKSLSKVNYFATEEELDKIYTPVHIAKHKGQFRPDNVVIIIIESFGKEYIGCLNKDKESGTYKGYTPFMDSLIGQSKTFHYSFANGKKSIDAMPSVLASIPSIVEPYVLTQYSGNQINSLASTLKTKGYTTSFFHGAPNGSMGFLAFANIAGFDHYVGKTEFNNDEYYDGIWGIWDEEFLQFYADKMNEMKQPFLTSCFTVSSHHPYNLPKRYEGKFPEGTKVIHKCIGYTDMALKKFFAKASTMPWFDNTLFIITADHTSAETYLPEYQTSSGIFSIPIVFYKHNSDLKGMEEGMVQQNDIMPTVLNYLNYDKDYIAFGNDAFDNSTDPFVINYNNGIYQIFMDDYLFQYDGQKMVGLYNFKKDTFLKENLAGKLPEQENKMEQKLKAFIQQYNKRLIDNKLTVQ